MQCKIMLFIDQEYFLLHRTKIRTGWIRHDFKLEAHLTRESWWVCRPWSIRPWFCWRPVVREPTGSPANPAPRSSSWSLVRWQSLPELHPKYLQNTASDISTITSLSKNESAGRTLSTCCHSIRRQILDPPPETVEWREKSQVHIYVVSSLLRKPEIPG